MALNSPWIGQWCVAWLHRRLDVLNYGRSMPNGPWRGWNTSPDQFLFPPACRDVGAMFEQRGVREERRVRLYWNWRWCCGVDGVVSLRY